MNFADFSAVKESKVTALKERIERLEINADIIEENFVKGSGKGGQKTNKTSNAVILKYPPLGIVVKCRGERKRSLNRFLALREIVDEIEMKISPETSGRLKRIERLRRKKKRKKSKSAEKYGKIQKGF